MWKCQEEKVAKTDVVYGQETVQSNRFRSVRCIPRCEGGRAILIYTPASVRRAAMVASIQKFQPLSVVSASCAEKGLDHGVSFVFEIETGQADRAADDVSR